MIYKKQNKLINILKKITINMKWLEIIDFYIYDKNPLKF